MTDFHLNKPDQQLNASDLFGIDANIKVPAFSEANDYVPRIDNAYRFNPETTLAILSGFTQNRRVLIQGMHGTGKSTHIEQVAARLNWPCVRINLDGHISRLDMVGKDVIVLKDNKQVTEFQDGILTWAIQRPVALIFDELDAARPEVMFVIQQLLEREGKFTLMDQNKVVHAHPYFRLFATANTVGLGNLNGLYHGTHMINQAQMDRWNLVARLNYLAAEDEVDIVIRRVPSFNNDEGRKMITAMVAVADLTRKGFSGGDLSTLMSPRTVIFWAENVEIFKNPALAFKYSFLNKCDDAELPIIEEYYQRCFGEELTANNFMKGLIAES